MQQRLLTFLVTACMPLSLNGQDKVPEIDVAAQLELTLHCPSEDVVRGAPVPVRLALTNGTGQPVETMFPIVALERIRVQYEGDPDQKWRRDWVIAGDVVGKPIVLQPTESREFFVELIWQCKYPIFERSGTYAIQASWNDITGHLRASTKVTVVEGNDREKQCYSELRENNLLQWLGLESQTIFVIEAAHGGRDSWREDLRKLFEIAKKYSDTPYANYALCSVLTAIETNLHPKIKADTIDPEFKREVIEWTKERCAQRTSARVLYGYAFHLYQKDRKLRETRDQAQELLQEALALNPDAVLKKRIRELASRSLIVLDLQEHGKQ